MALNSLEELLIMELKQLLDAENQTSSFLSSWSKAAMTPELKVIFKKQEKELKKFAENLAQSIALMTDNKETVPCKAVVGIIDESKFITSTKEHSIVKDAALIALLQKVLHYTIAAYTAANAYAKLLYNEEIVTLLTASLKDKKRLDKKLTKIAEGSFFKEGIIAKAVLFEEEEEEQKS